MCGILGALSETRTISTPLWNGLGELQNRGYDSMGVSFLHAEEGYRIEKDVCQDYRAFLASLRGSVGDAQFYNGIAHSRWATHGGITQENAHPHLCYQDLFCLVHNGIIENHAELRDNLMDHSIPFRSQTDSEVIVNLISFLYSTLSMEDIPPYEAICQSIQAATHELRGTFGLVIQCRTMPHLLFCIRWGSPLLIGTSEELVMVVSEKSAFDPCIKQYTMIDNHDLVVLQSNQIVRRFSNLDPYLMKRLVSSATDNQGDYSTWTEKEIMEQPVAIQNCLNNGSRITEGVQLGGLCSVLPQIRQTNHMILMGCGTSYHACLLAAPYFRQLTLLDTVQVSDASEFETVLIPKRGKTCLVVVSQSGETMDVVLALQRFRRAHPEGLVLGVVNVVDSLLACQVDAGVYMNCGRERGVASTKSFSCQTIVLFLMASFFAGSKDHLCSLATLSDRIACLLPRVSDAIDHHLLPVVRPFQNIFVIGKSFDFFIAMEAALKIKEISYVHSEAYSSSSLKHGPFALLNPEMLVILISTLPTERKKMENAYQEIRARNAPILVISYENMYDCPLYVEVSRQHFSYLEANVVLQVLALRLSLARGIDPDYPRNLAKVVTVE